MAKVIHVDGKMLGIADKEWNLLDSNTNVKKFSKLYIKYNEDILEVAENTISIMGFLVEAIPNILEGMLELTKTERKKLDDASFSDQYDIFREMTRKFLGIELNSMSDEEVPEDPKEQEE